LVFVALGGFELTLLTLIDIDLPSLRKTVDQLWTSLASDSGSSKGQTCKAATEGFTGVNSATRSKQATPIPNNVTHPVAH